MDRWIFGENNHRFMESKIRNPLVAVGWQLKFILEQVKALQGCAKKIYNIDLNHQ